MFIIDHKGNRFRSTKDLCAHYGIDYMAFHYKKKKGIPLHEIIAPTPEEIALRYNCEDHLGNRYPNKEEMCKHYGLSYDCLRQRIRKGFTLEEALTIPLRTNQEVTDHLGIKYKTVNQMCSCYNISASVYIHRIKAGWTKEEALTIPLGARKYRPTKGKRITYDGKEYESITKLCQTYDVDRCTFNARRHRGWTIEEALKKETHHE